ncbi:MAG: adenylate/guanylate cyclase domain-containing protein [Gammaproteobacteria bacterium]|jgi:adenylate cyclase
METQLPRRLAAIMYADVAGYSRLVEENEDLVHRRLSEYLDLIAARVQAHLGEVKHYAGDAVLAMFASVSGAVECALDVQRLLAERNADLPENLKMQFRIGINLGDVIEDRGDIYGDGVNLAARLEGHAEPGGICISAAIHQQLRTRPDLAFEDLGELRLKNIARQTRAYRLRPQTPPDTAGTYEALTGERLDLPAKASIAVLPFLNLSDDPGQNHFADGMSEDIITVLSRVPDLVVIARNSTFVYRDRAVDVREVGRALEVAYVLEGSVRRQGARLRVSAQLARARNGEQVWAERYDRNVDDLFAIQDQITREIVTALQIKLTYGEEVRIRARRTSNFEAWELLQRAYAEHLKFTREGNAEAKRLINRVFKLEPNYQTARVLLAWVLQTAARFGFSNEPGAAIEQAEALARSVIDEDDESGDAHAILCYILVIRGQPEGGVRHGERAVELEPSSTAAQAALATALFFCGDYEASLGRMKKALRLCPYAPDWILAGLGDAYFKLGQRQQARDVFEHLAERMPGSQVSLARLACIRADLGDEEGARRAARDLLAIAPEFSVADYVGGIPYHDQADREEIAGLLLRSGLPA